MIALYNYNTTMITRDESCIELNEIIYHITGKFWKQTGNSLLLQISNEEEDVTITIKQSIKLFSKELHILAKRNHLTCKRTTHNSRLYFSLIPFPIYIGIDKSIGEISVKTPHINTKHFQYSKYKTALKWIQNYINIDERPLLNQISTAKEKYYINKKTSEIIQTSVKSITSVILGKKEINYKLKQYRLRSEIFIEASDCYVFKIDVYHKAFSQDSSLLINLLNNPHEEHIEDKIHCCLMEKETEKVS